MKNVIAKLNEIGELPIRFTKLCLVLVMLSGMMLVTYCLILKSRGMLNMREIMMVRNSMEYLVASFALGISLGFLLDLAMKK